MGGCDILNLPPSPPLSSFSFSSFFSLSSFFKFLSSFFLISFSLFSLPFRVLIIYHLQIDKSLLLVFSTLTCPIPTGRVLYRVCQCMRSMPCLGGSYDKTSGVKFIKIKNKKRSEWSYAMTSDALSTPG